MYLEKVLPEFRKGAKIRSVLWRRGQYLRYDAKTRDIINEEGATYDITKQLILLKILSTLPTCPQRWSNFLWGYINEN